MIKLGFLATVGLSLTIFTSASSAASAEPIPAPLPMPASPLPDPKPAEAKKSYAWQFVLPTIAFDIVSLVGITSKNDRSELFLVGWAGRAISGPVVHFAHRRIGQGFASLALESLSPVLGGALGFLYGAATCDREPEDYCYIDYEAGMAVGAALFAVAGTIVDAALLANEPVKPEPGKETGFSWAPYVTPTVFPGARKGELGSAWTFGVAGRF